MPFSHCLVKIKLHFLLILNIFIWLNAKGLSCIWTLLYILVLCIYCSIFVILNYYIKGAISVHNSIAQCDMMIAHISYNVSIKQNKIWALCTPLSSQFPSKNIIFWLNLHIRVFVTILFILEYLVILSNNRKPKKSTKYVIF